MLFLSSSFACYVVDAVNVVGLHSLVSLYVCLLFIVASAVSALCLKWRRVQTSEGVYNSQLVYSFY